MTSVTSTLLELRDVADPSRLAGMSRVGINTERALGVSIPACRKLARRHRSDHDLALALWVSGIHEARIVASMVDDPTLVDRDQMEAWVLDFDSWDLCDQVCGNLFDHTTMATDAIRDWVVRDEEFVKRAGFALIAERAHRDHDDDDSAFLAWLPIIREGATDERNYVKKAVNWALRQIGKRNEILRLAAIAEAERLVPMQNPSARWIGRDALRELGSDAVVARTRGRQGRLTYPSCVRTIQSCFSMPARIWIRMSSLTGSASPSRFIRSRNAEATVSRRSTNSSTT
jgi:3-methyladenine DNA glycosylase AlkD